jgi:hypothetical protein
MTDLRSRPPTLPLLAAMSVAVLLAALASAPIATAKPQTKVDAGSKWISVALPTKKGWHASVEAVTGGRAGGNEISISVNGPSHESVTYGVHGRVSRDGAIVAKFPGLGRVNVRFDQTEVKKLIDNVEPRCSVGRETLSRKGTFRGRIDIHDPGVLGTIDRRATPGSILDFPAETCPAPKRGPRGGGGRKSEPEGSEESNRSGSAALYTGRKFDGGELSFNASTLEAGGPFGTKAAPRFDFVADFSKSRHGLSTFATASAALVSRGLTVIGPTGAPTEATVEPPAPFQGSATFKLESPTTASWTGDLSVEIPTLGKVPLTVPGTWSMLCQGSACTETLPPGMQFAFLEF